MASKPYETVEAKVAALNEVDMLIAGGLKTTEAVRRVSETSGISPRSLFCYRKITNFIPQEQWPSALVRKPRLDRLGIQAACHPEALDAFIHMCRHGIEIAESYRRTAAEAKQKGWLRLASERTLRRELARRVAPAEMRLARRNAGVGGDLGGSV
ncbi:DNA-binding domain-containing protein [Tabrizicola sp.]|uniref:DNA-binding domain-containing protein n=1 Tax=Tabrizicola sp. TaxID=2005166 RepID=UPI00345C40EB